MLGGSAWAQGMKTKGRWVRGWLCPGVWESGLLEFGA